MITVNSVFKYIDTNETIRVIEVIDEYVYLVNVYGATAMPTKEALEILLQDIETDKLIKVKEPYSRIIDEKDLSELQISKRDEDWAIIDNYWNNCKLELLEKKSRVKKFEDIAKASQISVPKVKKMFSRFWQRGMNKNALLPDYMNSGGKGIERDLSGVKVGRPKKTNYYGEKVEGINITDEVKKHFEIVINKYYRNNKKISLKETYNFMLKDFYSDIYKEGNEIKHRVWGSDRTPTYDQFYYWFRKNEDVQKDIRFREGDKAFELGNRLLLSNSTIETDGPGTRFQIDATVADIYIVSSLNRNRIIGRPVVYAIIDVFSRLVTGIYVGLEGPSWIGAMMALDNMLEDKVEFCKRYDINIEERQWPSHHLPEIIIADRGEFEGYSVENLINNLNIKIENTSPYRGDLKGIVERSFRTTNEKIKHMTPGAIQKKFRERGDRDYRLDSTLNLEEFTKIFINMVLHHNSKTIDKYPMDIEMVKDEVVNIPIELWQWGIENKKGRLKTIDRETFRLNILPKGKASISRGGIGFKGLYYSSEKAVKEQWFIKPKVRTIEIVYDPRNMNKIYVLHSDGVSYDECYLTDKSTQYKKCILEEIIFNQELLEELRDKEIKDQNQNNIDLQKAIDDIVQNAKKEKAKDINYNESSRRKLKQIRNNRAVEKEINREKEVFKLGGVPEENNKIAEVIELPRYKETQKKDENTGRARLMDKLRKKRDEKRGE